MIKDFYPRKNRLNRLPLEMILIGIVLVLIFSLILILNYDTFDIFGYVGYLFLMFIGLMFIYWGIIMDGKAYLSLTSEGMELKKKRVSKIIPYNKIMHVKRDTLDLGTRWGTKKYYSEIEITFKEKIFNTNEIWIYWNMLSFIIPSKIGMDERHWDKADLDSIASFIENKIQA